MSDKIKCPCCEYEGAQEDPDKPILSWWKWCVECGATWNEDKRKPAPEVPPLPDVVVKIVVDATRRLSFALRDFYDNGLFMSFICEIAPDLIARYRDKLLENGCRPSEDNLDFRGWLNECDRRGCTAAQVADALMGKVSDNANKEGGE